MSLATTYKSIGWIQYTEVYRSALTHVAQEPQTRAKSFDLVMRETSVLRLADWVEQIAAPHSGCDGAILRDACFAISVFRPNRISKSNI